MNKLVNVKCWKNVDSDHDWYEVNATRILEERYLFKTKAEADEFAKALSNHVDYDAKRYVSELAWRLGLLDKPFLNKIKQ